MAAHQQAAAVPNLLAPNIFPDIQHIPDLPTLAAFEADKPDARPNLPPPNPDVEFSATFTIDHFLDNLPLNMWEADPDTGMVLNFGSAGRKVLLSIGKIVAGIHMNGQFAGDLINRIRIYGDQSVNFPFPNMDPDHLTNLREGILTDIKHFRWLVARIIVRSLPHENWLPDTFKLFFSEIYTEFPEYSNLQLLHPIFFDANERMSFLQLIKDYLAENPGAIDGLRHLDYLPFRFQLWWANFPPVHTDVFDRVFTFNGNDTSLYRYQSGTLPFFMRNTHNHYCRRGHMLPTHEKIDDLLHKAFPGVCEVIVDGQIRSHHVDWLRRDLRRPYRWKRFHRSLAEYLITKPYPFTVEPYSYQY